MDRGGVSKRRGERGVNGMERGGALNVLYMWISHSLFFKKSSFCLRRSLDLLLVSFSICFFGGYYRQESLNYDTKSFFY